MDRPFTTMSSKRKQAATKEDLKGTMQVEKIDKMSYEFTLLKEGYFIFH
jgi:hypothetical protein